MNQRRKLLMALGAGALAAPLVSFAQRQKVYRIGYLANDPDQSGPTYQSFLRGLRERGWTEGNNVVIFYETSNGRDERFPGLAAKVVAYKVDVIVTTNTASTRAAKAATTRIPIVFGSAADPDDNGIVASLGHPGGNVTGLAVMLNDLRRKQLELLKDMLPRATRVARLYQGKAPTAPKPIEEDPKTQADARALGIKEIKDYAPESPDQIEAEVTKAATAREKFDAMTVQSDGMLVINRQKIAELAMKYRLPTMCQDARWTDAGALVSYGESFPDRYLRAAAFVDKILRGAKPANLPVERALEFELVINLKTAQALGITIPSQFLVRANRVIK